MTDWLLKFFNVPVTNNTRVAGSELVLTSGYGEVWLLLLAILLGAGAVYLYRREDGVTPWKRWTMAGLRAALFVMLLLLIARPVIRFTLEGDIRKALLVMIDASASMSIPDPRTEAPDQVRVAIASGAADPAEGVKQKIATPKAGSDPARLEVVRQAFANDKLDLIKRLSKDYDIRAVSFGEQTYDIPLDEKLDLAGALANVKPERTTTAVGDAIRRAISKSRGQPLAGLLVVTDGASNAGASPITASELATREGVPIYAWGVGITHPKDIAVASVFARDVAFIDDEIPVVARVRTSGLSGQSIKVVAKLNGKEVGNKTIKVQGDGEELVSIPITPTEPGTFNVSMEVDPLAVEAVKDNNKQAQQIRVIDGKIKVLVIEQQPRWEFKYLEAMLLRDRRIAAKFVLLEGDRSLAQVPNSPFLASVPADKEELFKYDLILIGDIDPTVLSRSHMDALEQFVSKFGGAVGMIAGRRYSPQRYTDTPIANMMPVEWETGPAAIRATEKNDTPIKFELTPAGKNNEMLRLADDEQESVQLWNKLPSLYWSARVTRPKPAAEVLLVDADSAKASRFGKMPIIAVQQYGLGQTIFIGTDNLWRWRKNAGDKHYARLWGQIIQRMALPHLLGESRRTQLVADKKSYSVGDRMTIYARLYNQRYDPIDDQTVRGQMKDEKGVSQSVILKQVPGQPGMYRAEMTASTAGKYKFSVDSDPTVGLDLPIVEPRLEFTDTAMNETLLRTMCETSRGAFFREEDLHKLPNAITSPAEKVRSSIDVEIWSTPVFFLLALIFAGAEWALRKTSYLK